MINTYTESLTVIKCGGCSIRYAVPEFWLKDKRETGDGFRCPNGCERHYGETNSMRLNKELVRERADHDQTREDRRTARLQRDYQERRASTYKGQGTRDT